MLGPYRHPGKTLDTEVDTLATGSYGVTKSYATLREPVPPPWAFAALRIVQEVVAEYVGVNPIRPTYCHLNCAICRVSSPTQGRGSGAALSFRIAVAPPGLRPDDSVRNMPSQPALNHPARPPYEALFQGCGGSSRAVPGRCPGDDHGTPDEWVWTCRLSARARVCLVPTCGIRSTWSTGRRSSRCQSSSPYSGRCVSGAGTRGFDTARCSAPGEHPCWKSRVISTKA